MEFCDPPVEKVVLDIIMGYIVFFLSITTAESPASIDGSDACEILAFLNLTPII